MITGFVSAVIITVVTAAIITIIKNKAKGKCTGCPYAGSCHKKQCSEERLLKTNSL